MRKFNLTSKVARRLADLEKNAAEAPSETRQEHDGAESSPARQPENAAFRIAWRSDIGKIRRTNQDAVILGNGLAGIADGMGGHQGGEIASGGLRDGLIRETELPAEPSEEKLQEMIRKINRELWEQAEQDEKLSGMGTTLTLLWPNCREMLIAQVGDSRAYLLRDGVLQQMTEDHSMVADMVRRGILSEEQAACHPMRNYITRAVGTDETVDVDITHVKRRKGDRWLICSDGLHALVSRDDLCRMLSRENIEEAANEMLETALGNGGRDNISLVLMEDLEGAAEDAAAAPAEQANSGEVTP